MIVRERGNPQEFDLEFRLRLDACTAGVGCKYESLKADRPIVEEDVKSQFPYAIIDRCMHGGRERRDQRHGGSGQNHA
jgi:hypothetical protein